MKNITYILNGYSSKIESISGGTVHSLALINCLVRKKYNITICYPKKEYTLRIIKGVDLSPYPSIPFEEYMYKILLLLFLIYCYRIIISIFKINRARADIIISSSHLFHDIVPTLFIKNKDITFITYVHHIISEQRRQGISFLITKFLEKLSFCVMKKRNYYVFVDSKRIKEALINKYGFREKNIYVTKNGIDLNFINSVKVATSTIYDVCFCGRLHKTKGVYDLINIIQIVKKYYPNILCAIIGQGGEKENLDKIIKKNDLENNIKLLGFVSEKEKIETMKSSKLFLLPSHEEGWGIVIGEAMACGLPVIAYKLKDITGIWKDNVVWIDCFNINKFSDAIIMLLKDNKKREFFIKKGLKYAKTLDWHNIMKKESNIIKKIIKPDID